MDTSDVLLAARDMLREHGWTQKEHRGDDGSLCLIGALEQATDGSLLFTNAVCERLARYCGHHYGNLSITFVNDYILTSADEACELLEATAKWDGGH